MRYAISPPFAAFCRLLIKLLFSSFIFLQVKAITTRQRKDQIGMWVVAAFTPLAMAPMLLVSHVMGFVPSSGLTRYALIGHRSLSLGKPAPCIRGTQQQHGCV